MTLITAPGAAGGNTGSEPVRPAPIPSGAIDALRAGTRVTVLTGSGISAESGVPTFREAQTGLWAKFRPEELATQAAFQRNPRLVWQWYNWRREMIAAARPNAAHRALVEMARRIRTFTLITQNVDGLHQRAGSSPVIELHGNIHRSRCYNENVVVSVWEHTPHQPPRCPRCGGLLRPDVVWFEETLPDEALAYAYKRSEECDVFLCVGTSGVVYPAANLPMRAVQTGAVLIVINPDDTALCQHATYSIRGFAGDVVPRLAAALKAPEGSG